MQRGEAAVTHWGSEENADYVFSLKTNRFLSIYSIGYMDGEDRNENTPSVSGGTCTKID